MQAIGFYRGFGQVAGSIVESAAMMMRKVAPLTGLALKPVRVALLPADAHYIERNDGGLFFDGRSSRDSDTSSCPAYIDIRGMRVRVIGPVGSRLHFPQDCRRVHDVNGLWVEYTPEQSRRLGYE